jgi:hypothetical protein
MRSTNIFTEMKYRLSCLAFKKLKEEIKNRLNLFRNEKKKTKQIWTLFFQNKHDFIQSCQAKHFKTGNTFSKHLTKNETINMMIQ